MIRNLPNEFTLLLNVTYHANKFGYYQRPECLFEKGSVLYYNTSVLSKFGHNEILFDVDRRDFLNYLLGNLTLGELIQKSNTFLYYVLDGRYKLNKVEDVELLKKVYDCFSQCPNKIQRFNLIESSINDIKEYFPEYSVLELFS
jgi:hypothetical protein